MGCPPLFSARTPSDQCESRAFTRLHDHLNDERWCAWALRDRLSGPTKVPFQNCFVRSGKQEEIEARSNNPDSWVQATTASLVAQNLANCNANQIGVFLGINEIIPGYMLGGTDYDTCFEADGSPTWWAQEAVNRLDTYTEVSPSRKGMKGFFLYRAADLARIETLTAPATTGKQFKLYTGGNHPPGLEWYFRGRFFAVTFDHYPHSSETINAVGYDDLVWLTKDLGPRISKRAFDGRTKEGKKNREAGITGHDNSRSAQTFRRVVELRYAEGLVEKEEIKAALLADPNPDIRDWMDEKGLQRGEYEFSRLIDRTKPITQDQRLRCRFAQMQRNARLAGDEDPFMGIKPIIRGKHL